MKNNKLIIALFCLFLLGGVSHSQVEKSKIKGVSFVGANEPIDEADIKPIIGIHANWVTLMPFGFIGGNNEIEFNSKWQWWGEKEIGIRETILKCQKAGLKIMMKPQIWIPNGYTGDYELKSEEEWNKFERSYLKFVQFFMRISQEMGVEMFCIGTEWGAFIKERPAFWDSMISTTKAQYSGQLVYAANWDDYQQVPFWDKLDYIGVNAYFPISYHKNPSQIELIEGWKMHKNHLSKFSKKQNKKILFTEIGYRSMKGSTIKPWEHHTKNSYSAAIQDRAYQALFEVVWKEEWLAGMFIWKWYHNHESKGNKGNIDFTPQNKMAESTIRKYWLD